MACNGNGSPLSVASVAVATRLFFQTLYTNMTETSTQFASLEVASDDLDLVHASKDGDVTAFEQLVKRYDRKLYRIAQSITHNREDSQDAVQEALLKAFQNLGEFREESQFSTWLIRITVNQSLMKLRKQRATREVSLNEDFQTDSDALPMEIADWAPNPEQLYRESELRAILIRTLKELPLILRAVFVLRDIEGLSIDQTAQVLNVSHTAVKARLWRSRLQLRERLNKYFSQRTDSAGAVSFLYKYLAQAAPLSRNLGADQSSATWSKSERLQPQPQ